MLKHIKINESNIKNALAIHKEIFPNQTAKMDYEGSVNHTTEDNYFILYVGDTEVGVSGIFRYPFDRESAWLGWFGIREHYRRRRFGSDALRLVEETARDLGYKYIRILIERDDYDGAMQFFVVNGYTAEQYDCMSDPLSQKKEFVILSRSLYQERLPLWNNRNLKITEQIEKRNSYK